MQFLKECLFPSLGVAVTVLLIVLALFLIIDALTSVVRAAKALERIADALECDEEDDKEDDAENNEENLTPGTVCAGSLRPPRIVPGASMTQNENEEGVAK